MKTVSQVRQNFWDSFPQFKAHYKKGLSQNDYNTDIRVSFCDHIEYLRRNGEISEKLANRVTL